MTEQQRKELGVQVIKAIKAELEILEGKDSFDLSDIGNSIGYAVGLRTAKKNLWSYEKNDFIHGYGHGYSLTDGTH